MKLPGPSATEPNVYTFGTPYAVILDDLLRKDADLYTRNRLLQARPQPAAQHLAPLAWLEQHMPGLTPGLLPAHTRAEVSRSCPCYPLPGAARALHRVPRLAALLDGRHVRAQMLHRNAGVKAAPQRWQDCSEPFDVAVTFEERILEQLLDGLPPACSPRPKLLKSSTRVCPAQRVALNDGQLTRAADMQKRGHSSMRPLLVINIVRARPPFRCRGVRAGCCGKRADGAPHAGQDVKDNHEEAAKVAPQTLRLCQMVRTGARPHAPAGVCGACSATLMRHLGQAPVSMPSGARAALHAAYIAPCMRACCWRGHPAHLLEASAVCWGSGFVVGARTMGPPARTEPFSARSWSSTRSGKKRLMTSSRSLRLRPAGGPCTVSAFTRAHATPDSREPQRTRREHE